MLLIIAMLSSLTACKESEEIVVPDESGENTQSNHEPIMDPETGEVIEYYNPELAKTGVYEITDIDLGFGDRDVYVTDAGCNDNGAYYVVCENDIYWNHAYYLCELDNAGNFSGQVRLSLPADIDRSEGGEATAVMKANEEKAGISYDDIADLLSENKIKYESIDSVYYEFFHYAGDGIYEAVIRVYADGWEECSKEYSFNVRWNEDGECTDILYLPVDTGEGYIDNFVFSPDGRVTAVYNYYKWDDDAQGERAIIFSEDRFENPKNMIVAENDDLSDDFAYIGEFVTCGDKLMVLYESYEKPGEVYCAEMDTDTFEPADPYALDTLGAGTLYPIGSTDDGGLVFNTINGLQISQKGEKASVLLDAINSDFREDGCGYFVSEDGTDVFYLSYLTTSGKQYIAYCKKVLPEDVADCKVITYGSNVLYGDMIDMIVDFNEKNTGTRIVFKNYQFYEKRDDYEADLTKMYEDMKNGRMADIVFLDPYSCFELDLDTLSRKGVFADIGELIDNDPDMSREDYLTNIFDAFSYDGKLYRIVPSFSISSAYGNSEYVSGHENWNVDEFLEYADGLDPEESLMFTMFETRQNFLEDMLRYDGYCWIDKDRFSCDFTDISFMRLLGYASRIPEEIDYESIHMLNYWDGYDDMYYNGEIRVNLSYMPDYKGTYYDAYAACKTDPVFVGFPSPDSQGSVISYTSSYMLSADSPLLNESWDFIKQVLQMPYQDSESFFNFPVLRSSFEEKMEDCLNPFVSEDEEGYEYEYMPSYAVPDGFEEVPLMSQEQADAGKEFICSVDRLSFEDRELTDLILNEINTGFETGKSSEEIASSVQIVVQAYLDEKKAG